MAKKVRYTVEREFLKKHEIREAAGIIISQYIKDGKDGEIPNYTAGNLDANQNISQNISQ